VLASGYRTRDLAKAGHPALNTEEMGGRVAAMLEQMVKAPGSATKPGSAIKT
jgi:hypothetical protein